jgi:hypothetical protein
MFVIRIEDGDARVVAGKVAPAFLHEVRETCGRHGVKRGAVRGVVRGRRIGLEFPGAMPPACRQQLRNLWNLSGWSAAPRRDRV